MAGEPSGLDIAAIVGGAITILGALGAGLKFLFSRADRREKFLDAKEAALVKKLEARLDALEEEHRKLWIVINYVVPALHSHDPTNPALRIASKILKDRFPVDFMTPADMTEALRHID
jgi:hypothetical protein